MNLPPHPTETEIAYVLRWKAWATAINGESQYTIVIPSPFVPDTFVLMMAKKASDEARVTYGITSEDGDKVTVRFYKAQ